MKLVKIQHRRCNDWSNDSYVFAPDEMDQAEIERRCTLAQKEYFAALEEALKGIGPRPEPDPLCKQGDPDNLTLGEARARREQALTALNTWYEKRTELSHSYGWYLARMGLSSIDDEELAPVEVEVDWGHRHGSQLDYSNVEDDPTTSPFAVANQVKGRVKRGRLVSDGQEA